MVECFAWRRAVAVERSKAASTGRYWVPTQLSRRSRAGCLPCLRRNRIPTSRPPTIEIKGLPIHLQSAVKLERTLAGFAATGEIEAYDEITPLYSLSVSPSTEGIELSDSTNRVAITKREAGKWASLMSVELERLNTTQFERGQIRTTLADCDGGRWILQWGDAVFIPSGFDSAFKDDRCENRFRMKENR